jgi:hypothetical protein
MTTRRWLIVVAAIALMLGSGAEGVREWERRARYLEAAAYHADQQQLAHQMSAAAPDETFLQESETHHAMLRRKYERAASRPWEVIPIDAAIGSIPY